MSAPGYEAVIGLEVHVQLATRTKIFCGCSTRFGAPPNSQICPVCTGQPGALPRLNRMVIDCALRMALATGCQIRRRCRFARKNYFYPDLPKGYQISQFDEPLAEHGVVELWHDGAPLRVGITRIHVEEDAGKSLHVAGAAHSLVDLNRAGVPLIEIVSEPDLRRPEQAAEYMRTLRGIVRALGISDGNMEQGSLRCDANISLRPAGSTALGTKVEVKNINSFRFVQRALEHETERQSALLDAGESVTQETRLYDAELGITQSMRSKEEAHDYRYFPEPDLPPLEIEEAWLEALQGEIPELPLARRGRLVAALELTDQDAGELTRERELADYFEATVARGAAPKRAASWILTELLSRVGDPREVATAKVTPEGLAGLLGLWDAGRISGKLAKEIFARMWESGESAETIAQREGLFQQSDEGALEAEVLAVIQANPEQVAQYRAGKHKVLGFFVGQVMKATRGKANPQLVNQLLQRHLDA
jgi:aspartyl-tRNA(Asn)/glutamyl-tRNA(Gln) amidotransferase subunit B